jgi:hypothetical protein
MSVFIMIFFISCEKEETNILNVQTSTSIKEISAFTAKSGGNVIGDGGKEVTERGVVWSTSHNPTIDDNLGKTNDGSGIGEFVSTLSGLSHSTVYYVRAYAKNSEGIAYGSEVSFTTLEEPWIAKHITNVLIEDFTATWCGYCPRVHYAIKSVTEASSNVTAMAIYDDSDKRIQY